MSSFSSVVRKSGVSIKPKAPPRRNISRRANTDASLSTSDHDPAIPPAEQHASIQLQTSDSGVNLSTEGAVATSPGTPDRRPAPQLILARNDVSQRPREASARIAKANIDTSDSTALAQELVNTPKSTIDRDVHIILDGDVPEGAQRIEPQAEIASTSPRRIVASHVASHDRITSHPQTENIVGTYTRQRQKTPIETHVPGSSAGNTSSPASDRRVQSGLDRTGKQNNAPKDLLQSATEQAASVSSLANDIELQTRARNSLLRVSDRTETVDETQNERQDSQTAGLSKSRKRKRKTAAEQAAEVIASATRSADGLVGNRSSTPEGAKSYQLEPDETTMGELILDRKLGKKSQLEEDMQRDWGDIVQRRKEARDLALENAQKGRRKAFGNSFKPPLQATISIGPRTEIRNGKIVVIEESRQIDRNGALEQAAVLDAENVREDKLYYKRVNQNTVGMKAHAGRKFRWDEESTDQFFRGLQMFGTDFLMIANLFPGLDRKQIKTKFIREENANKSKVMAALADRLPINLDEYSKITELTLEDPAALQAEIDAEEQRLKDEDHERRVREGFVNVNTAEEPIQSTEGDDGTVDDIATDSTSRYAAVAEAIMAPKKRQRKASSSIRKGLKGGRRPAEGVEEILGSINEVRV